MAAGDAYHWIHTRSRCSASYTRGGKGGGGGGVSVIFSTIYIRILIYIYIYIRIHIYAYLLLYLYVCPRSTPILYRIAHTFIAYTHIAHILDYMFDTIHMLDTLGTNYVATMLAQGIK